MNVLGIIGATLVAMAIAQAAASLAPRDAASGQAESPGAQALVDRGLAGPAGPDDEGAYRLIDPIGPGGASASSAAAEVFASTMIGGQYTKWRPYHDPFSSGGGYGQRIFREDGMP